MSDAGSTDLHAARYEISDREIDAARRRWGISWLALCGALAIHVFDEATTDFLSLWNPLVASLRHRIGWLPLPSFEYATWLGGLILGITALVSLTPLVFRGVRWIQRLSYALSVIMIGNGLGHIAASIYMQRPAPGVASSPLLLVAAACLLRATRRHSRLLQRPRV